MSAFCRLAAIRSTTLLVDLVSHRSQAFVEQVNDFAVHCNFVRVILIGTVFVVRVIQIQLIFNSMISITTTRRMIARAAMAAFAVTRATTHRRYWPDLVLCLTEWCDPYFARLNFGQLAIRDSHPKEPHFPSMVKGKGCSSTEPIEISVGALEKAIAS